MKEMYRVSYGTRSWWTAIPERIQKREVVKETEKTVLFLNPIKNYVDGKYVVVRHREDRENKSSDGVKWFATFDEAKVFVMEDQEHKLNEAVVRVDVLKGNLKELESLKDE